MKSLTFKRVGCAILALSMAFGMAACTGGPGGQDASSNTSVEIPEEIRPTSNEITIWHYGDAEHMIKFYEAFETENPGYVLDYTVAHSDLSTLAAATKAGQAPDMTIVIERPAVAYYSGLFTPLDKYVDLDPEYKRADIHPMAAKGTTYDNKLMFLTDNLDAHALAYNKTLFENAGLDPENPPIKTYSQFEAAAKALTKFTDGYATQLGYKGNIPYYALTSAMDKYVTLPNGYEIQMNTPETIKALEFSKKVPEFYGGPSKLKEGFNYDFGEGTVAMQDVSLMYGLQYGENIKLGLTTFPVPDDFEGEAHHWAYVEKTYAIPKAAKNPNGGWLYMKWFLLHGNPTLWAQDQYEANPEGFMASYSVNKFARDYVNDKYQSLITSDVIRETWKLRDEIYEKVDSFQYSDAQESEFHDPFLWKRVGEFYDNQKSANEIVREIQEYGDNLHAEWKAQKLSEGWVENADKSGLTMPEAVPSN